MTTAKIEPGRSGAAAATGAAFRRILVHFDLGKQGENRMDLAVALAREFGGKLIGVHVQPTFIPPAFVVGQLPPAFLIEQEKVAQENAEAATLRYHDRASRDGLTAEWHCLHLEPLRRLRSLARYADLAIMGQIDPDAPEQANPLRPEDVALASGRPVLVVPYIGAPPTAGRRVAVAWDGGREAARAVSDALPLLRRAEAVWAISVDRARDESRARRASDLANYLADHGIQASAKDVVAGDDIGASDLLLSMLSDLGADMLVMGCYGHSRMREVALGGMTREVLAHMTVPVLMSH